MGLTKWREVIQGLFTGDQDYMLLKIREASVGTEIEAAHECPGCKAKLKTTIATDELEVKEFNGQREIEFELPKGYKDKNGNIHRNGKLRLPTGLDRELLDPAAKKNLGEGNTLMLVRCIVDLDGLPCVTPEMIRSLVLKDRNYLFDLFKENMFGLVLESDVTCDSCQREFRASLNATNFL
jgi:hypothetical protein